MNLWNMSIHSCLQQVKDPQLKRLQAGGVVGTLMYMAPELLKNEDFSEKIDVYR